jgi:ribose-phosphate pyrophosphokinase
VNSAPSMVLGFSESEAQSRALADLLGIPFALVDVHRFPDGESRVRVPPLLPPRAVVYRSLDQPNAKLFELGLAATAARCGGATDLTLVAPYLCYMRQDKAFVRGEAVSQTLMGALLASWFDTVISVDPHLHRVSSLGQAVPARRALALSAAAPLGDYLVRHLDRPLLLGPDRESRQWVAAMAEAHGLDYAVAEKDRLGDREVAIRLPGIDPRGRNLVLVDDVISTGHTLAATAEALRPLGSRSITVLVTHGLFVDGALERLAAAGVDRVWSSDSVPHPTNRMALAPILAQALSGPCPGS